MLPGAVTHDVHFVTDPFVCTCSMQRRAPVCVACVAGRMHGLKKAGTDLKDRVQNTLCCDIKSSGSATSCCDPVNGLLSVPVLIDSGDAAIIV